MEVGHQVGETVIHLADDLGQGAPQLPGGLVYRPGGAGVDQVGHCFHLSQIQPAAEKGPASELPGLSLACPGGEQGVQPQGQGGGRAVALQLRRVLPGVAVGTAGEGGQTLVNGPPLPVVENAIHQLPVRPGRHGDAVEGCEHLVQYLGAPRPGQPQDANGGGNRGGGDGGNHIRHNITSI